MLLPRSHESVIVVGIGDTMNRRGYSDTSPFQLFSFHLILHPRVFFSFLPFFGTHWLTSRSIGSRKLSRMRFISGVFSFPPPPFPPPPPIFSHLHFDHPAPPSVSGLVSGPCTIVYYLCSPRSFFFLSCRIEFAVSLSFLFSFHMYTVMGCHSGG